VQRKQEKYTKNVIKMKWKNIIGLPGFIVTCLAVRGIMSYCDNFGLKNLYIIFSIAVVILVILRVWENIVME